MFKKSLITTLLLIAITSLFLGVVCNAEDFGNFKMPRDVNGVFPAGMDFVGLSYTTSNSTDCVNIQAGDSLIYFMWLVGDGTDTDWCKVVTSTYTAGITLANTACQVVYNASTSVKPSEWPLPVRVTDAYIVTNDANNVFGIYYK